MITITPHNQGFNFKMSNPGSGQRGKTIFCRDVDTVHVALDHYHLRKHDKGKCPLCDDMKGEKQCQ